MWDTLKFHNFQIFTVPRDSYIPSFVKEFYEAYGKAITKSRSMLKVILKPFDVMGFMVCKSRAARYK